MNSLTLMIVKVKFNSVMHLHQQQEAETFAVDEDDVLSLVGRARARVWFADLGFSDPCAEALLAKLDVDASAFDEQQLRIATVRTMVVDSIVRHFFERHPDGLAVSVHAGICTRFSRVDNGRLRWLDLDLPAVAELKSELLERSERHTVAPVCGSLACTRWMDLLADAEDLPTIIVAQGALLRACRHQVDTFLTRAAQRMRNASELVFDYDARQPLRRSSRGGMQPSLESRLPDGSLLRYPRLRLVSGDEYPFELRHELDGLNGASRFFAGRGIPSVAHVRFA
jgi:O-methyltransferase involved in polyketide biosynthesis